MTLNTYIIIIIMFIVQSLFEVTLLLSIIGTSSALLSDNMSTADGEGRKSLDVVVTVAGVSLFMALIYILAAENDW